MAIYENRGGGKRFRTLHASDDRRWYVREDHLMRDGSWKPYADHGPYSGYAEADREAQRMWKPPTDVEQDMAERGIDYSAHDSLDSFLKSF